MSARDDFNTTVSSWLDDQAGPGAPDYLDEVLARTSRTRQRPAWASLERFLPTRTTLRFAPVPRAAWLLVVLGLVVAIGAAALLIVGSRPRIPAPFGPAANGVILYSAAGRDIHVFDPANGTSRPLIAGPTTDETPHFSRDGTKFVFARESTTSGLWHLMIANADGSNVRPLTEPIYPAANEWSPEGSRIAVVDTSTTPSTLSIHHLDGTPPTVMDLDGLAAEFVSWRPDGRQLVFRGTAGLYGLYVLDLETRQIRPVGPPAGRLDDLRDPSLSPDGTRIVYTKWVVDHPTLRMTDLDAGTDRELTMDGRVGLNGWVQSWSPNGTQLLFTRLGDGPSHFAVGSVAGGPVTEVGPGWTQSDVLASYSPDGSKVIAHYFFDDSTWMLDLSDKLSALRLPSTPYPGTWQRTAP